MIMRSLSQSWEAFFRQYVRCLKFEFPVSPDKTFPNLLSVHNHLTLSRCQFPFTSRAQTTRFLHSVPIPDEPMEFQQKPINQSVITVQNVLKFRRNKPTEEIKWALDQCELTLAEDLVLNVLRRHRSDSKLAYVFFNWVCERRECGYSPGSNVFNEIVDVLGNMQRFGELAQVLDEMSKRGGIANCKIFETLIHRYAAAHKVDEAIDVFHKRREFGVEDDLEAFQRLLMWLCRYKHVDAAETLFVLKKHEFVLDIKTMNIVLNGWCVLGNVHEAKRFWKDIIASRCKPDLFTYSTFINALTKKGKLGTALKLFRAMWDKGCYPDVVICNCIIDALCFKKRIPEALKVFKEISEQKIYPNVATYNSLIKHLCKIHRMEKVYEFLDEMELRGGSCLPNSVTYSYLLKSAKKPEEVPGILERMERNRCKMTDDTYNLMLKLYTNWDQEEKVRNTWNEMERNGVGPDQRSYTIMIHGLHKKGMTMDALRYFKEMTSKGMMPEARTDLLISTMNPKLNQIEDKQQEKLAGSSDN